MKSLTYFISDLHLGAGYIANPREHERTIAAWLKSIEPTAKALYLLGDVMDYWYEYRTVVPRGYVRFFGALADLADSGCQVVWLKGNHDVWLFDYLQSEIGLTVRDGIVDTMIDGKRFVMEHGDGIGEPRQLYRLMRGLFRNRFAQWLYAGIHPRWTVGFALNLSKRSRLNGSPAPDSSTLPDSDPIVKFTQKYTADNGHVDYFIFGHRHQLVNMSLSNNSKLILLGEAFNKMTYGVWNGEVLTLKKIEMTNISQFNTY